MSLRLPLGGILLALAVLALHDGASNTPLPYAGLAVGVALALTVALDAIWARRGHWAQ